MPTKKTKAAQEKELRAELAKKLVDVRRRMGLLRDEVDSLIGEYKEILDVNEDAQESLRYTIEILSEIA